MRYLIADDEPLARAYLGQLLQELGWHQLVGEASSGTQVLELVTRLRPEVVFLDIQMPGLTGLEVMRALDYPVRVVLVTAYDHHAVEAFEREAVDYVLKPVRLERLRQTLNRLQPPALDLNRLLAALEPVRKLAVLDEKNGGRLLLELNQVLYAVAEGDHTYVHTRQGRWRSGQTLAQLEVQLKNFYRCHRAYLVHLEAVEGVFPLPGGNYSLRLRGGPEIPLARRQAAAFKARIGWLS